MASLRAALQESSAALQESSTERDTLHAHVEQLTLKLESQHRERVQGESQQRRGAEQAQRYNALLLPVVQQLARVLGTDYAQVSAELLDVLRQSAEL